MSKNGKLIKLIKATGLLIQNEKKSIMKYIYIYFRSVRTFSKNPPEALPLYEPVKQRIIIRKKK